jgi:hypothetical protein
MYIGLKFNLNKKKKKIMETKLYKKIKNDEVVKNHIINFVAPSLSLYELNAEGRCCAYEDFIIWLDENYKKINLTGYHLDNLIILIAEDLFGMYSVNELCWNNIKLKDGCRKKYILGRIKKEGLIKPLF